MDEYELAIIKEEMEEAGFDEMFIECTLDDLREGGSVEVWIADNG